VVRNGVNTPDGIKREMPAWEGRLSDEEIRMLTLYVHDLGGGAQ
jgi:cytochrome c oxidase cbb3-type subunit 3